MSDMTAELKLAVITRPDGTKAPVRYTEVLVEGETMVVFAEECVLTSGDTISFQATHRPLS